MQVKTCTLKTCMQAHLRPTTQANGLIMPRAELTLARRRPSQMLAGSLSPSGLMVNTALPDLQMGLGWLVHLKIQPSVPTA